MVASRKIKITYVACIFSLLDITILVILIREPFQILRDHRRISLEKVGQRKNLENLERSLHLGAG